MGGEETGDNMIKEIDAMFDIANDVFDLDTKEKSKYAQDVANGNFTGYVISVSEPGLPLASTVPKTNKNIARKWMANRYVDGRRLAERR